MGAPARILLVDEKADARELYALALRSHGYAVEQAADPEGGLRQLSSRPYDLVIVHYNLPGRTGSAMLREARTAGLIGDAATLIFSGHPDVDVVAGAQLLRKPFDVEALLRQVGDMLRSREVAKVVPSTVRRTGAEAGDVVELVLYVSESSPTISTRARRNVEQILARYDPARFQFSVSDVAVDLERAEEDRVMFTPTLVKRSPAPRAWVVGNLSSPEVLEDLLSFWGVDPVGRYA